ncbi:hypothetical protein [Bacillus chungangensis]|uniref:Competence protein ComG n=1 Tax=Bacillus chungangensis TaxID=587633 RepID=A0ABT9WPM8_9BACI|nr:hypothetical protein [Bacillus chungangensis]MDQ0175167.1 hypothetical protein [Bacillus chungangensis]
MFKNENGFSVIEALLSFSFIMLMTTFIFPLLFKMMIKLEAEKKSMTASRLLYEQVEAFLATGVPFELEKEVENTHYQLKIDSYTGIEWRACVVYDKKQKCMSGQ